LHLPILPHDLPRQTSETTSKQFRISVAVLRPAIKMPSLLDLSAELKIMIVHALNLPARPADDDFITPSFQTPSQDIINLGRCCKTLREITATKLYSRLRLRNNDKSGLSILAVAASPWAHLVRELHFEGVTTVDAAPSDKDLPASVSIAPSALELFPRLDTLTVRFMFGETGEEDFFAAMEDWDCRLQRSRLYYDPRAASSFASWGIFVDDKSLGKISGRFEDFHVESAHLQ
jgi:hypothetical protein